MTGFSRFSLSGLACFALIVQLLAGCATTPSAKPVAGGVWPVELASERAEKLAPITTWKLQGRLGVQLENDGFSAALTWLQDDGRFDIRLFDPVGRRVAWLRGTDKAVDLQTAQGQSFSGDNPEKLLQQYLGWSIPVKSLAWWVKGLPDPTTVAWRQEYDDLGRLVSLEQGGWTMRIASYQNDDVLAMPKLTRMQQGNVKLKLLIKSWE